MSVLRVLRQAQHERIFRIWDRKKSPLSLSLSKAARQASPTK